tara:strand:+ start:221 stop:520 length:300 start_codon:yes stop_codon:yes gene_type:complete
MSEDKDSAFFILAIDDGMALFLSSFKLMQFSCSGDITDWSSSTYSGKTLSRATGLSERCISKYFNIASMLCMISPDGSVHPTAERYVKALINTKVKNIK